ncbi:hypothetical protein [Nonomuraea sp. NPDC002799]
MPSDPDHVLDAIDGVVDEWETLSSDAMRWAPPETKSPDLVGEVTEIFGPLANAFAQVLRPLSDAFERVLNTLAEEEGERAQAREDGDQL